MKIKRFALVLISIMFVFLLLVGITELLNKKNAIASPNRLKKHHNHLDYDKKTNTINTSIATDYLTDSQNRSEAGTWRQIVTSSIPPARDFSALTYDSERRVAVLFGGRDTNHELLGDTWEYDGVNWGEINLSDPPSARNGHAMTYDNVRGYAVLAGGFDGGLSSDTWEWDGTSWIQRHPYSKPNAPTGHAMAFDDKRGVVVLFGGFGATYMNKTWEWDGDNWVNKSPSISPPARAHPAMAYDSQRSKVVLFGGYNSTQSFNDTWEWDGVNWTQLFPIDSPSARNSLAMTYDSTNKRVVLFGGKDNSGKLNDMWLWDGVNWTEQAPSVSPPIRSRHVLAFDTERNRSVLFGGEGAAGGLNDTWEYVSIGIQVTPTLQIITPGDTATFSITIDGSPINISLTTPDLPQGLIGKFFPSSVVTPTIQSTLLITSTSGLQDGIYPLSITAQASDFLVDVKSTISIVSPDFDIIPFPQTWTIPVNTSVTYSIGITGSATFNNYVDLALEDLPQGVVGGFSSNHILPSSTTDVWLTSSSTTTLGSYEISIIGSSSILSGTKTVPLTHTAQVPLSVLPPNTPTPTSTPSPTITRTPTPSATPKNTKTPTLTLVPTDTPTLTPTKTPVRAFLALIIKPNPPTPTPTLTSTSTNTTTPTTTPSSTLTPLPTSTDTPLPTATPTPTPIPSGVYILSNHSFYVDSIDNLWIVGEVWNNTTQYLHYVKVSANIYSSSGQLLATDYTYIDLDNLPPYEKTCFDLLVMDVPIDWSYYEFEKPSYWTDGKPLPNLTIFNYSGSYDSTFGWYEIIGQVRNDHGSRVEYVSPVGTIYNASGTVIGCDFTYINSTHLDPGQTSAFEITFTGRDYIDVASYRLQVDGNP